MSCHPPEDRLPVQEFIFTPKSTNAIPVRNALSRDLVVQTALDPAVDALQYVRTVQIAGRAFLFDGLVATRDGARYAVAFVNDAAALRTLDDEGLGLLAAERLDAVPLSLCRDDVMSEPRRANARRVWSAAGHHVRFDRRLELLDAIDREGAMRVREFAGLRDDLFALACESVIDIELDVRDLGAASVRRRLRAIGPRSMLVGGPR